MGKIVEKKKKKKGRPSLLDLQKRNLREQQELQQLQKRQQKKIHHHSNNYNNNSGPHSRDNYASATPTRRSARRNPNPGEDSPEKPDAEDYDDEDDELAGKRREKKLKLVLRLPPNQNPEASLDSGGDDSNADEDTAAFNGNKKRKINAISDGSGNKGDKLISGTNQSKAFQESAKLDSGPSTPLPDKKLLVFIIDRLQKKDTYGVFSDPVDPEELPDYHDVIEHPMDFGTLRKKLSSGAYSNLEQFEKDVFLICSNAMQYNAPETIYFRQARSIHELAKKNFENLRQDSDDSEPEPKIVKRGRPPTKNLKKAIGRPSSEPGPEIPSDAATIATGIDNASFSNHDLRKSYNNLSDKSGMAAESSERLHGLRNDLYSNWLADNKFDRSDEFTGSLMRSNMKNGKKQVVHEESRRNTYIQPHQSVAVREPSVLMTFDAERKQLMPVGVLVEHGYARSLARFAANLGPVAWKVASKKIERSLPTGTKFGPGWVGENDLPKSKMPQHTSNSPNSSHTQTSSVTADPKAEILPETPVDDNLLDKKAPPSSSSGPTPTNKSPEPITPKPEPLEALNPQFPNLNNAATGTRPKSPFLGQKWAMIRPGMNGFNGFNLPGLAKPPGLKDPSSHTLEKSSRTNTNNSNNNNNNNNNDDNDKVIESVNALKPEETNKAIKNRGTRSSLPNRPLPPPPALPGPQPRPTWQGQDSGLSPKRKPDSVPPDLNVGFQSPGSPSSSRVDSTQPDLALQL